MGVCKQVYTLGRRVKDWNATLDQVNSNFSTPKNIQPTSSLIERASIKYSNGTLEHIVGLTLCIWVLGTNELSAYCLLFQGAALKWKPVFPLVAVLWSDSAC